MLPCVCSVLLGSLSKRVFETRTATGSELFPLLTCVHSTTVTLLSIFSPLEIISTKIWEIPLSWHAKSSLPVAVRVSKTRVLKFPSTNRSQTTSKSGKNKKVQPSVSLMFFPHFDAICDLSLNIRTAKNIIFTTIACNLAI